MTSPSPVSPTTHLASASPATPVIRGSRAAGASPLVAATVLAVVTALGLGGLAACARAAPADPPTSVEPTSVDLPAPLTVDGPDPRPTADDSLPGARSPADVLGPGRPVAGAVPGEQLDLAVAAATLSDPSEAGASDAVALFVEGWAYGATTGDRSLLDLVSGPSCTFCTSVADGVMATVLHPEDGYALAMTLWEVAPPTAIGDSLVAEVVLHVSTTFTQLLPDGTPHVHMVQDEAQVLRAEVRWDGDRWTVAGIASTPWTER